MVKKLYFCGVTPVKGKHEGGSEIALTSVKTVKIFTIFSEKDSIFPGELLPSQPSGQLDLDHFLSFGKIEKQKKGMAYGGGLYSPARVSNPGQSSAGQIS